MSLYLKSILAVVVVTIAEMRKAWQPPSRLDTLAADLAILTSNGEEVVRRRLAAAIRSTR